MLSVWDPPLMLKGLALRRVAERRTAVEARRSETAEAGALKAALRAGSASRTQSGRAAV